MRRPWPKLDRSGEGGDRVASLTLLGQDGPQRVVGFGMSGIEAQRVGEGLPRGIKTALPRQGAVRRRV